MRLWLLTTAFLVGTCQLARADSFTTFVLNAPLQSGGTLSGTLVLDATQNMFVTSHLSITSYNNDSFSFDAYPFPNPKMSSYEEIFSTLVPSGQLEVFLYLPITTLAGYNGSTVCSIITPCPDAGQQTYFLNYRNDGTFYGDLAVSGKLTSVTPEPQAFLLVGSGLLGLAGLLGLKRTSV